MTVELCLSPGGRFYLSDSEAPELPPDAAAADRWRQAFGASCAEGFLALAAESGSLPASLAFARAYARLYLNALCRAPRDEGAAFPEVSAPASAELASWLESAPPFRGLEFFDAARASALWVELHETARRKAAAAEGGVEAFLHAVSPVWRTVGRVTFHLAENKRTPGRPFAFMVTYASQLSESGRVQHLPLKRALEE